MKNCLRLTMENRQFISPNWKSHHDDESSKGKPLKLVSGTKRKAPASYDYEDEFLDIEFKPPKIKQFFMDDAAVASAEKAQRRNSSDIDYKSQITVEDVNMENDDDEQERQCIIAGVHSASASGKKRLSFKKSWDLDDDEANEELLRSKRLKTTDSDTDISAEGSQAAEKYPSMILSEEVRASISTGPNGHDESSQMLLPKSIIDHMTRNSQALVLWQPPQQFMQYSIPPMMLKTPENIASISEGDGDNSNGGGITTTNNSDNEIQNNDVTMMVTEQLGIEINESTGDMEIV